MGWSCRDLLYIFPISTLLFHFTISSCTKTSGKDRMANMGQVDEETRDYEKADFMQRAIQKHEERISKIWEEMWGLWQELVERGVPSDVYMT